MTMKTKMTKAIPMTIIRKITMKRKIIMMTTMTTMMSWKITLKITMKEISC